MMAIAAVGKPVLKRESTLCFFEGVEKLLEVWFTTMTNNEEDVESDEGESSSSGVSSDEGGGGCDSHIDKRPHHGRCSLRKIPRDRLEKMLVERAKCEIISHTKNSRLDAYVLSESSMFISQRRFILKTCGRTTPLEILPDLRKLAKAHGGLDAIENIFYSRKNFARPDLQPNSSFETEVALLDSIFMDGAAYCMGSINRDCWYLYTLNPLRRLEDKEPDQTIEILMQDLDSNIMSMFNKDAVSNAHDATRAAGIDKIIPNMRIDDYLFEPCGYSMNAICSNGIQDVADDSGEYMTIHVTPEPEFSYVSFETNIPSSSYIDLIRRVIDTFLPGKFILTIFAHKNSCASDSHRELLDSPKVGDWKRLDAQYATFQAYELTYAHYIKCPP